MESQLSLVQRRQFLTDLAPFQTLPDQVLDPLSKKLKEMTFAPRDVVIKEGAEGDYLYIVIKGHAEVTVLSGEETSILALCHLGRCLGSWPYCILR